MIKKYKILVINFSIGALLVWPAVALAQDQVSSGLNQSSLSNLFGGGRLTRATSVQDLIVEVIRLMLLLAGAIAVVFVIIGGYQYVTSGGSEEQAEKGKKTLINAIIGIVIIILSYTIINVIAKQINN